MSLNTSRQYKVYNFVPPKIYFLPKIHKPSVPYTPIVSNIGSLTYKLAKLRSKPINAILGQNDYHTTDSWSFAKSIPPDYKLLSLDVTSLYTNVPIDLALRCIEDRWNEISSHTFLPREGVKLWLDPTFFQHKGVFYQQIDGVAMGSPISPAIANLVMETLDNSVITSLNYQLPFYKRYVDDILTTVHKENLDNLLHSFNQFHPRLNFTSEVERDNKISFLDMSLDWYQKPTKSGRYLQYTSHHPEVHKKCVVAGLFDRGLLLSDPILREKNLKPITNTLTQNGYPPSLIDSIKVSTIDKLYNSVAYQEHLENNPPSYSNYTVSPYVKGLSEQIQSCSDDGSKLFSKYPTPRCDAFHV